MKTKLLIALLLLSFAATAQSLQTGAEQLDSYLPLLKGKRVGVTANHTSIIGDEHLVDVLIKNGVQVVRIYAPEHGFRGTAGAGEKVDATKDERTGIEIASLYGKNFKPTAGQLKGVDCMLFDMQDVGTRFYTYLSTMHYVMEACAEHKIPVIVLDRPNPNGFYVDGPILEKEYKSFVGMHPIPIVHGMTLGELAQMINGEGWLKNKIKCDLTVVPCAGYTHTTYCDLPVSPSPSLPTMQAIHLYPSLCLFEGTPISVGRGTNQPFEMFGHPVFEGVYPYNFTPQSMPGVPHPPFEGEDCYGENLHYFGDNYLMDEPQIRLHWLIDAYSKYPQKDKFFTDFFYKLCGTKSIRQQIESGMDADRIRDSWQPAVEQFKLLRKNYLLYPDFE